MTLKFTLARKIVLMILSAVILVGSAILGGFIWTSLAGAEKRIEETIELNMRVAWSEVNHLGTDFHIEDGKLGSGPIKF